MIEIWAFITWSKSINHKFSSKFRNLCPQKQSIFKKFSVKLKIFKKSTQDMCRFILCKYETNLRRKGAGQLVS